MTNQNRCPKCGKLHSKPTGSLCDECETALINHTLRKILGGAYQEPIGDKR